MTQLIQQANKIVIKVGSSFVIDPRHGSVHQEWVDSLVDDIAKLKKEGKQVILVSSGAIIFGCNMLNINPAKTKLQEKQNAAVCGQHELMATYKKSFARHGINVAQALVTIEDVENRKRFVSIKSTIDYLLEKNIVPIVNENDLIANTEIRFGDNDRLSARIAQISNADLLVMFSLVDGLYTADPKVDRNSKFVSEIYEISADVESMATDSQQKTGGMSAKVVSAKIALNNKCNIIIANGTFHHPIKRLLEGAKCSSFVVNPSSTTKYKID